MYKRGLSSGSVIKLINKIKVFLFLSNACGSNQRLIDVRDINVTHLLAFGLHVSSVLIGDWCHHRHTPNYCQSVPFQSCELSWIIRHQPHCSHSYIPKHLHFGPFFSETKPVSLVLFFFFSNYITKLSKPTKPKKFKTKTEYSMADLSTNTIFTSING